MNRAYNVRPLCKVCGKPLGNRKCKACRSRVPKKAKVR